MHSPPQCINPISRQSVQPAPLCLTAPSQVNRRGVICQPPTGAAAGPLRVGDIIHKANGYTLDGRLLSEVLGCQPRLDEMTFTFELAERPLEAAVLTFARASKAQWRELAALLPDWDPAAPLVPPGCAGEKRELKELVMQRESMRLIARRIARDRSDAFVGRRKRSSVLQALKVNARTAAHRAGRAQQRVRASFIATGSAPATERVSA